MGAFVIVLREAFEATLVLGLIFAFLDKTGQRSRYGTPVWAGTLAAVAVSVLVGLTLFALGGDLSGSAQAVYEGSAMLVAAGVLTWMVFWMRRQASTIGGNLRSQVSDAVGSDRRLALASLAFIAVLREGIETALFLYASVGKAGTAATFAGGALGLVAASALGVLLYMGSVRINLRIFFRVTGLLVIGFAAYLLAGGLAEMGDAIGSDAGGVAGAVAAVLYAAALGYLYLRRPRPPARVPASA